MSLVAWAVRARNPPVCPQPRHVAGALNSMAGPTPEQAEKIAAADDACVMAYKALSDSKRPSYGVERHALERFSRSQRAAAAFILVHPYSWRTPWSAN